MKITNIRYGKLVIPLITPFKTALRTVNNIEDIIVIVETDTGEIGYGSAPATPVITGDTHGSIIAAIDNIIKPKIMGCEIANLNEITQNIQGALVNNYSAKAAVEIAIYDLWGKYHNAPLYKLLGGGKNNLRTDVTISVNDIDTMVDDALRAISEGFDILKIKIGNNIHQDIKRVQAIYKAVCDKAQLRLDVNQGWTKKQTVYAAKALENSGVELELIEQPVKADDFDGMLYISERVLTPIMADESAFGPKQVFNLIKAGAADIINIKLMKTGGLSNAIKIADIAEVYHVDCMIGCMLEGSIGAAAAAHLAVAKANVISKVDLDGPALGQYDPVIGGVSFEKANISLSELPGLGIQRIDGMVELKKGEL